MNGFGDYVVARAQMMVGLARSIDSKGYGCVLINPWNPTSDITSTTDENNMLRLWLSRWRRAHHRAVGAVVYITLTDAVVGTTIEDALRPNEFKWSLQLPTNARTAALVAALQLAAHNVRDFVAVGDVKNADWEAAKAYESAEEKPSKACIIYLRTERTMRLCGAGIYTLDVLLQLLNAPQHRAILKGEGRAKSSVEGE